MLESGHPATSSRDPNDPLFLLHSIILDPDCLEPGLRLLAMDRVPDRQAYLAWGLDRCDRPVLLYVARGVVHRRDLREAVVPLAHALYGQRSREFGDAQTGRVLAVAAAYSSDLLSGCPTVLDDWTLELVLCRSGTDDVTEDDVTGQEEAGLDEPRVARLSAEEVESLVGSWV